MSLVDRRHKTHPMRSSALTLTALAALAVLSLSACSSHVVGTPKTSAKASAKASAEAQLATAATKTAACARVVTVRSQLSAIEAQVFQTMSVGNESGVWGPIVMDLDRQKVLLAKEMTAKKLVCDGPTAQKTAAPSARATTAPGRPAPEKVNQVRLDLQTWKIDRNPKDKVALKDLADLYFLAHDYENARVWQQKLLDFEPKDEVTLTALGASQYNLENFTEAEKQWRVAEWLYPSNVDVHYDLGFLYQHQTPPDKAKMMVQWRIIMLLEPDSDVGRLVAPQMK